MGQYKVPQDVEAEDHILGPLTFKQFIYAMIGVGWAIASFALFRTLPALLIVLGFPPTMLLLLLAFYRKDGQNFEQILIAMIEFFAATRKRLWTKEDIVETFHIEKTKAKVEQTQRDPARVRSELDKLATMIDSRGWNRRQDPAYGQLQPAGYNQLLPTTQASERMVGPQLAPHADQPRTDMLDLQRSPMAQNLAAMLQTAADDVRKQAVQQMTAPMAARPAVVAARPAGGPTAAATLYQATGYPAQSYQTAPAAGPQAYTVAAPGGAPTGYPAAAGYAVAQPGAAPVQAAYQTGGSISGVTQPPATDMMMLANQNSDLSVQQLAAQANRVAPLPQAQGLEVSQNGR